MTRAKRDAQRERDEEAKERDRGCNWMKMSDGERKGISKEIKRRLRDDLWRE